MPKLFPGTAEFFAPPERMFASSSRRSTSIVDVDLLLASFLTFAGAVASWWSRPSGLDVFFSRRLPAAARRAPGQGTLTSCAISSSRTPNASACGGAFPELRVASRHRSNAARRVDRQTIRPGLVWFRLPSIRFRRSRFAGIIETAVPLRLPVAAGGARKCFHCSVVPVAQAVSLVRSFLSIKIVLFLFLFFFQSTVHSALAMHLY